MSMPKNLFVPIILFSCLSLINGCKLTKDCEAYMDICLISNEKEKDLLNLSNNSNNSQLYKSTFNSYKIRIESIKSQEIYSQNKDLTESATWKKMISDMRSDNCKFFSKEDVSKYNNLGIGPELLNLLKQGNKIFCD